jgi:uncharacterized membrane protein
MKYEKHKSSLGLDANIVVLIVWLGGSVISTFKNVSFLAIAVPIVIYFIEKDSKLVRAHALQAIGLFLASLIASIVFILIPLLWLFFWIIPLFDFIVSILAIIKGYNWEEYEVPLIQPVVRGIEKILGK